MKFEKFKKMDKQKKIILGSIIGIILIIGSIALFRSYALYEEKKEFNVIRGKVPDFGYDIKMISILVNEEKVNTIPSKPETGFYKVDVTCDKGVGEWDYRNWKLSLSEFEKETRCNISFTTSENDPNNSEGLLSGTIVYLGEGTSFDVSSYNGYENFTANNFIIQTTGYTGGSSYTYSSSTATNLTITSHPPIVTFPTISYNPSTGIAKVNRGSAYSVTKSNNTTNKINSNPGYSIQKVYLVI